MKLGRVELHARVQIRNGNCFPLHREIGHEACFDVRQMNHVESRVTYQVQSCMKWLMWHTRCYTACSVAVRGCGRCVLLLTEHSCCFKQHGEGAALRRVRLRPKEHWKALRGLLQSRAECPTALHLLHSRNGHEPDFCRCPGVLHSAQYFEHPEFPVRCVSEPQ